MVSDILRRQVCGVTAWSEEQARELLLSELQHLSWYKNLHKIKSAEVIEDIDIRWMQAM